jgi:hypothetical protein
MLCRQHGSADRGHLQALYHPMKIYNAIQCTGLFSYGMITEYLKMINTGRIVMPEWYLLCIHKENCVGIKLFKEGPYNTVS